jgi:molybdopterin-containing oxidoreductase family membrane subunit
MRSKLLFLRRIQLRFLAWILLLIVGIGVGLYAALQVFTKGLVITNLTNLVPWGLWITVDLSSIALSGGAFFLSALVYIVGIKRFRPIARLAVFIGILGYSAAMCTLLLDIGRPERFWHALAFWNGHSMLWEVSMCITLYFSVLSLEVFPMVIAMPIFNRWTRIQKLGEQVHKAAPVLAYLGLGFSLLHQSSLGAIYGVLIARPIWFRPTLPLIFVSSAIAAGPALTIVAALLVRWLRGHEIVPADVLFNAAKITGAVTLIYLYIRFWDVWAGNYGYVPLRSEATAVLTGGVMSMSFWAWEIVLGGILPSILLFWAAARRRESGLFIGSSMIVIGLVVNRWHTTMIGFLTPLTTSPSLTYPLIPTYTPSLVEWGAVIGILSGVLLAFTLGMHYLPIFTTENETVRSHAGAD